MGNKWARALAIIGGLVIIISLALIIGSLHKAQSSLGGSDLSSPRIISVDDAVAHPENAKGFIAVSGTVFKSGDSEISFLLGCEDACVSMPIIYSGAVPKEGTEITAYGEIKVGRDNRYIFRAIEIKPGS